MKQMYAEPQSWAVNDADLARLREQLAEAERVAESKHSTWTQKTRAGQDAKQIRRQLEAAEIDRARKLAHEARQTADFGRVHARYATATRDGEGTYAEPTSWAANVVAPAGHTHDLETVCYCSA